MMYYYSYIPTSFHMQQMRVTVSNKLSTSFDCYILQSSSGHTQASCDYVVIYVIKCKNRT